MTAVLAALVCFTLLAAPRPASRASQTAAADDHEFDGGSFIDAIELSPDRIANLVRLGKVWGFLKYHHPLVISGALQWDYSLFRVLPAVLDATDGESANAVLAAWAGELGIPEAPETGATPVAEDAHLKPELDWIHDEALLGEELSAYLAAIHGARRVSGAQHYVGQVAGVGNPVFDNELAYADLESPDAGYRLLALFRFWNIIRYWFPYRDLIEESWDAVLEEFVPRLVAAETRDDYALQMMALIARVHDTHANLWSSIDVRPPRGQCSLPVQVRFVEGKALVVDCIPAPTAKADRGALHVGDVLLELGGTPIERLVEEWAPYYAASNVPTRLRDIGLSLTQGRLGPVGLKLERAGTTLELSVDRVPVSSFDSSAWRHTHDRPGETFQLLSDEIAYLKLSSVDRTKVGEYLAAAAGTRGWVIDIRNYPSSFMVFALGQHLVSEPAPFARFTCGDLANPGAFVWTEPLSLQPESPRYEGRVVILIDEVSQSQAEYTTMALRVAPDAIVVGSTTAGADGNVSAIPLPGGLRGMISGIGVFYPDKTPTQRVGIVPDIEVRPTIAGLLAGRDEVLEVALREILAPETPQDEIQRMARVPPAVEQR